MILFGIIANHRLTLWRTRRDEYRADYAQLCDTFSHAIDQLKSGDTTLNLLILGEYPKHEAAASKFINHLTGNQRVSFQEILNKYREKYQELQRLGPPYIVATAAIAPSEEALNNATPSDMKIWELNRTKELYQLIHDLLEISKIKKWL